MARTSSIAAERQGIAGVLSALLVLTLLLIVSSRGCPLRAQLTPASPSVTLVVDHRTPVTVSIAVGARGRRSIIDISHDGTEAIGITVPLAWKRREVRNATLTQVKAGEPKDQRVRWSLPPHTTVSFEANERIDTVGMQNPGKIPLHLRVTVLDLEAGTTKEGDVLIKEEPATLP